MSTAPFLITRPIYAVTNIFSIAISTREPEDEILLGIVEFLLPVVVILDNYLEQIYNGGGRSMGEEQAGAYGMLAGRLASQFGVDGRACLQRFMCEMQQRPIDGRTIAGKLLTLLLTPHVRTKRDANILTDYLTARKLGQSGAYCDHHYGNCPISVFNYFDNLRNATSF